MAIISYLWTDGWQKNKEQERKEQEHKGKGKDLVTGLFYSVYAELMIPHAGIPQSH